MTGIELNGEKVYQMYLNERDKRVIESFKENETDLESYIEEQDWYADCLESCISNMKDTIYELNAELARVERMFLNRPFQYPDIKKDTDPPVS